MNNTPIIIRWKDNIPRTAINSYHYHALLCCVEEMPDCISENALARCGSRLEFDSGRLDLKRREEGNPLLFGLVAARHIGKSWDVQQLVRTVQRKTSDKSFPDSPVHCGSVLDNTGNHSLLCFSTRSSAATARSLFLWLPVIGCLLHFHIESFLHWMSSGLYFLLWTWLI